MKLNIVPDFADVSHYEKVDFDKYKLKTLITKATEGSNGVDPTFSKLQKECKNRDIKFGAYHFLRCNSSAMDQVNNFIKTVGKFDMPPILDVEELDGCSTEQCKRAMIIFLDEVEKYSGMIPIIYASHAFIIALNLDDSFARYPLWIAKYTLITPIAPAPWKNWWAWQYSDKEPIQGIGLCDANVFNKKV